MEAATDDTVSRNNSNLKAHFIWSAGHPTRQQKMKDEADGPGSPRVHIPVEEITTVTASTTNSFIRGTTSCSTEQLWLSSVGQGVGLKGDI